MPRGGDVAPECGQIVGHRVEVVVHGAGVVANGVGVARRLSFRRWRQCRRSARRGVPADRDSRLTAVGDSGWRHWLPTVTSSGRPGWPIVERVVDRVRCSTGASCAFCAIGRAIGAASGSGAGGRVSRNEQVVGSMPTGGSQVVRELSKTSPVHFVAFVERVGERFECAECAGRTQRATGRHSA